MTLEKMVSDLKAAKDLSEIEVDEQPRETLAGRLARQRNAKTTYKDLREKYAQQLLATSAFVIVSGPKAQEFADAAVTGWGSFSVSADLFFQDLADRIPPSLYIGKENSAHLLDVVSRHVEDKAHELGILAYPQIIFKQENRRILNSKQDLVVVLKEMLLEQMGAEIVGIQAVRSVVNDAIDREHSLSITPIMIVTDEKSVNTTRIGLTRLTMRVTSLNAAEVMSEADIPMMMQYVRDQLHLGAAPDAAPAKATKTFKAKKTK